MEKLTWPELDISILQSCQLKSIVDWHKEWMQHADMKKQCLKEIKLYSNTIY
jgi:hypothetical protein